MLSVANISKKFGIKTALESVSFEVGPREIYALIGPNGSGKTTTIKIITGLLRATSGSVAVDGRSVVSEPISAKRSVGYIPDEPVIWSGMTGEEFLHFTGSLYGMERAERDSRIAAWLSDFSLQGIEKDYFENYSRGNKQKFAIMAAMMHDPKVLIVDEPIVGLDPTSADVAKLKFVEFAKRGGAVLLATHTLPVAQAIATRIGVLQNGHLRAQGSMTELRSGAGLPSDADLERVYHAITKQ